jgi:hypothetical protein
VLKVKPAKDSAGCYHAPSALLQAQSNAACNKDAERFGAQRPSCLSSREADLRAERNASGADNSNQK